MKKIPKYKYILCFLMTLATIFCCVFAVYSIMYGKNLVEASILATLAGVTLAVTVSLFAHIYSEKNKPILIERKLNDEHFVDRDDEYAKLSSMLKEKDENIFYLSGKMGMGKTYFLKMICDRINFLARHDWKGYVAFYFDYDHDKKIDSAISKAFCGRAEATVADVSRLLNSYRGNKKCILFIDNISEFQKIEATEFAKAFVSCNKQNKIVISIDGNCSDANISPSQFCSIKINMLADSYNINIPDSTMTQMDTISRGYPIYAHYNVKAYSKGVNITDYIDISCYLEELIKSLEILEKKSLSLIICLSKLNYRYISRNELMGINNAITEKIIDKLEKYSFISCHENYIFSDSLIDDTCYSFLSKYHDESYCQIYNFFKNLKSSARVALLATLKSNMQLDFDFVKATLKSEYENSNFYFLITVGELDNDMRINSQIRNDEESCLYIRYYFLNSLLELGYYHKARAAIDNYSHYQDLSLSVVNIHNDLEFEYQYMLNDLEHLTNHFKDAASFSCALAENSFSNEQKMRSLYQYAHCIRHIGEDLQNAFNVFQEISNEKDYTNDKIRIRSLYSAASIKMFEHDTSFDYEATFDEIEQLIVSNPKNDYLRPYVNRHKALYEFKIKNNIHKAQNILTSSIEILEKTSLRIKYDVYFELAELLRISSVHQNDYDNSLNYYMKAMKFSKEVGDFNLESNALMGIALLRLKFNMENDPSSITNLLGKLKNCRLNINYNNAIFILRLLHKETIEQELIDRWNVQKYSDLYKSASGDKNQQCLLKLTVM